MSGKQTKPRIGSLLGTVWQLFRSAVSWKWRLLALLFPLLGVSVGICLPFVSQRIYAYMLDETGGSGSAYFGLFGLLLGLTAAQLLFQAGGEWMTLRLQKWLLEELPAALYQRLLYAPSAQIKQYGAGACQARMEQAVHVFGELLCLLLSGLTPLLLPLAYLFTVGRITPELLLPTLLVLAVTLAIMLLTAYLRMRWQRNYRRAELAFAACETETVAGLHKILRFHAGERFFNRWSQVCRNREQLLYKPSLWLRLGFLSESLLLLFGTAVLMGAAAVLHVSAPSYLAFATAYGLLAGAVFQLASGLLKGVALIEELQQTNEFLEELDVDITLSPKGVDRKTAAKADDRKAAANAASDKEVDKADAYRAVCPEGAIRLSGVRFAYLDGGALLENIQLNVKEGQMIGIFGANGSGKTTLLRLIAGVLQPDGGTVTVETAAADDEAVGGGIGVVFQDTCIFSGSLAANLTLTPEQSNAEAAVLWELLEEVQLAEEVALLPMGLHTILTAESGVLSSGQRQRLLLARALYRKPAVLLLDEATSGMDEETELAALQSLKRRSLTCILVSQHMRSFACCDAVYQLAGGKLNRV